jgi:hypothetical protein
MMPLAHRTRFTLKPRYCAHWALRGVCPPALTSAACLKETATPISPPPHPHLPSFCREIWCRIAVRGTFRSFLRALWARATTGDWPADLADAFPAATATATAWGVGSGGTGQRRTAPRVPAADSKAVRELDWYITPADLEFFKAAVERDEAPEGTGPWERMMYKEWPHCKYTAYRRMLPVSGGARGQRGGDGMDESCLTEGKLGSPAGWVRQLVQATPTPHLTALGMCIGTHNEIPPSTPHPLTNQPTNQATKQPSNLPPIPADRQD